MTKKALVAYPIGNFKGEVLCDFLPMDACYVLLGRACQFEKGYNSSWKIKHLLL